MDKNFVNVDDLVRQRLLGGEEREPAGAWVRMSELLEKEMPERPAGFGWRRMFGGLAVLLLLSGLGLGGYKMSSFRSLNGTGGAVAGNAAISHSVNAPVVNTPVSKNTTLNTENNTGIASNTENNIGTASNTESNTTIASTATANNRTASDDATANNVAAHKNRKANNTNNSTADNINNNSNNNNNSIAKVVAANTIKADNIHREVSATHTANKMRSGDGATEASNIRREANTMHTINRTHSADENKVTTGDADETASIAKAGNNKKSSVNNSDAVKSEKKLTLNSDPEAIKKNAVENTVPEKKTANQGSSAGANVTGAASNSSEPANDKHQITSNNTGVALKTANRSGDKQTAAVKHSAGKATKKTAVKGTVEQELVKNGVTPGEKVADNKDNNVSGSKPVSQPVRLTAEQPVAGNAKQHAAKAGKHNTTGTVGKSSMVLSSGAPVVKTNEAGDGETADNEISAGVTGTSSKTGLSATSHHKTSTAGATSKNAIASNVAPKTGKTSAKAGRAGTGNPVNTPAAGGSKAGKIAAVTPPAQRGKHVIQRLIVNQRLIPCGVHESILHLDTVSIETVTEEYEIAAAKPANESNGVAKSDETDDTSPIITTKERYGSDASNNFKTKGAMALEGLNAAFNDIKFKAGHAVFSAGITGGINGTFFGPNNFKGFQFGVTGKLSFTDELAIMGELKYFNRINNNYSLNDDYYQYSPVAGGYSRELVKNPYSISTLQSVEMPVTLQFSKSNFNFILGPNFSYAFGINAGEYPAVVTTNTSVVASPGNDNTPKIKANDFNPRFGVGYLLGVSYQLSPKVYLDLRDVQTFWDNSKTAGGKYISSQLYRSPSFQLSIGYRFGGNKHKD